jgi:hypothetical protein
VRDAAPVGVHLVALEVLAPQMVHAPLMECVTVVQMAGATSHDVAC